MSTLYPSSLPPIEPTPIPVGHALPPLIIGAKDLPEKDLLILRSLVRLLDGRGGLRLKLDDTLADCNVVFVPGDWSLRLASNCVSIRVHAEGDASHGPQGGLELHAPLRASNVNAALHAAADLLSGTPARSLDSGLPMLFHALTRLLLARERRSTLLPLIDGRWLLVDFAAEMVSSMLPLDEILRGEYQLAEPRRCSVDEQGAIANLPTLRLRDLVWATAGRLGDSGFDAGPLRGRYRLVRWPDAAALSRPGVPRLAALFTHRSLDFAEACAASGASPSTVRWFIEASLALGIAVPAEGDDAQRASASQADAATRGLLGRLKERLKLW